MSCRSENTCRNVYGKCLHQRSIVPTKGRIKIYNVLFLYFMFVSLCWNVVFLLEPVGNTKLFFMLRVGMKKMFRKVFEYSNKLSCINIQIVDFKYSIFLERWFVGTVNDRQIKRKNIYEN